MTEKETSWYSWNQISQTYVHRTTKWQQSKTAPNHIIAHPAVQKQNVSAHSAAKKQSIVNAATAAKKQSIVYSHPAAKKQKLQNAKANVSMPYYTVTIYAPKIVVSFKKKNAI